MKLRYEDRKGRNVNDLISLFLKESKMYLRICGAEKNPNEKCILFLMKRIMFLVAIPIYVIAMLLSLTTDHSYDKHGFEKFMISSSQLVTPLMLLTWYLTEEEIVEKMQNIQNIFTNSGWVNVEVRQILLKENNFKSNVCKGIFFFTFTMMVTAAIGWLIRFSFEGSQFWINDVTTDNTTIQIYSQPLPFPAWTPFNCKSSRNIHFVCGILIITFSAIHILAMIGFNSYFCGSISFAVAHFKIAAFLLSTMPIKHIENSRTSNTKRLKIRKENSPDVQTVTKKYVTYLNSILEFCYVIENSYNKVFLFSVGQAITLMVCSLVTLARIPVNNEKFITYSILIFGVLMIVFAACYYGQMLTEASASIPSALYSSNWMDASISYKSGMIITIMRMQKPVKLTIGKFSSVTLFTFIQIVKIGYSWLAVTTKKIKMNEENN